MTIKEFRLSKGLSQGELATALGISVSSERSYEYGVREPSAKVIAKLLEVYGVDLNAPEAPAKGRRRKAAAEKKAEPAPKKAPRKQKAAAEKPIEQPAPEAPVEEAPKAPRLVIQSPMGGDITPEEILAKVGAVDTVYVRVDENKAYWVKGDESGSVELW